MRRLTSLAALSAVLTICAATLTASSALAGRGPKWQFQPAQPFTLPALFCGFKVRVTPLADKEYSKILKTADGSMTTLITGSLTTSFTNLSTGKTITENTSGPGEITTQPGSLTVALKGRTGLFLVPADAKQFGLPAVSVTAGALTESIALPSGTITALTLHGHVLVNVCAALS
jgi:hypothetical protein